MKFNWIKKINFRKGLIILLVAVFVLSILPRVINAADSAEPADQSSVNSIEHLSLTVSGLITSAVVAAIGKLMVVVIRVLVSLAQYNDFLKSPVVDIGWRLIRDLCNMLFIVILLVIAFATVLQREQYSYKRMLGALVLAAVLVNFSKLICGVIIDFSQVVMLTFVNAIKDAAEGNFAELIGIKQLLSMTADPSKPLTINSFELSVTYLLALIFSIVGLVIFIVVTVIVLLRIIILWFLVMLSPVAFIATILPRTNAYASRWWDKFTNQVIVGPVLMIFIWLSLSIVQQSMNDGGMLNHLKMGSSLQKTTDLLGNAVGVNNNAIAAGVADIGQAPNVLGFMVGIALLVGSVAMAQELSAAGSGMAMNAVNKMKQIGAGAAAMPGRLGGKALKAVGQSAVERFEAKTGIPIQPKHYRAAWENRKRIVRGQRAAQMMEKMEGHRFLRPPTEFVNNMFSTKGWKAGVQRMFGVDVVKRNQAAELNRQLEEQRAKINGRFTSDEIAKSITQLGGETGEEGEIGMLARELEVYKSKLTEEDRTKLAKGEKIEEKKQAKIDQLTDLIDLKRARLEEFENYNSQAWREQKAKEAGEAGAQLEGKRAELKAAEAEENPDQADQEKIKQLRREIDTLEAHKQQLDLEANIIITPEQKEQVSAELAKIGKKFGVKIDEADEKNLQKQLRDLSTKRDKLRVEGEVIMPTSMPYEDQATINAAISQESKNLQGIEDADELVTLYQVAKDKKDLIKMRAIILKLTENRDLNELLDKLGHEQNYKGLQELIEEDFVKHIGGSAQAHYSFGNDVTMLNKHEAAFEFSGAYIRGTNGKLRTTTDKEHRNFVLIESGKRDRETLFRKDWWGWLIGKRVDPNTGKRVPIWTQTIEQIVRRDLGMLKTEIDKSRLNSELESCFSHPEFIAHFQDLQQRFVEEGRKGAVEQIKGVIKHLQMKQGQYWPTIEEK
ncbi:MAG: hypothetical protein PHV78_03095 [Patescibacteria group bacterium]|nr:hypothetical protein [Patescibacteria group bacterium]MDD5121628.1 hypothetical protein [Patescibacteria group bacterium]MDD5221943.1 hypothetical protein [Patescibacteria group bacterium]MDD5396208.1 hypothetical protein [Patescibacteria group bacterium]